MKGGEMVTFQNNENEEDNEEVARK